MEINILTNTKEEIKLELENVTIAEILRVYLNKDSNVEFVAWRQEHPTKKPILDVKTKGKIAKKAVDEAVSAITKQLDIISKDFDGLK